MKLFTELVSDKVSDAFEKAGYDREFGSVSISKRPDLCEFQCNGCMALAKKEKKNPIEIAEAVVAILAEETEFFSKAEAAKPGFINLSVTEKFISEYINNMWNADKFGYESDAEGRKAVIDYGGANVAKPLHVGHLRSAVIGESIKRMYKFAGSDIVGDVHLGDWGLQMGLIIEQLRLDKPDLVYFDSSFEGEYPAESPFTLDELEQIYPKASARSKEDEEFLAKAQDTTLKLQNGDKAYTAIWKHIMALSKADLKKNYDNLDVSFDIWKGESDAQPFIGPMIKDFEDRGIAHESNRALVVDVSEETDKKEMPPCIIRKSDGAALYATSDLATIIDREQTYHPEEYIYVADKRQELHFTQVFRTAKKAGLVSEDKSLRFLGFGTMNGTDGKPFKTRAGGVMRLEYLIEDIKNAVADKMKENNSLPENEINGIAEIVGLAALKYGDLSNQATRDYIFDVDRFTSFEGNTGPYILYTVVRIKSILEKAGYAEGGKGAIGIALTDKEKQLELKLAGFAAAFAESFKELAPHKMCQFMYEVADVFNGFYHDTNILNETDENVKNSRLALLAFTRDVLTACLDMLAIKCPDKM